MIHHLSILFLLLVSLTPALTIDCDGPGNNNIRVDEFTAFPPEIPVGGTLYIRATVTPTQIIPAAQVQIRVYYSNDTNVDGQTPLINIPAIDFCTISSAFKCPLKNVSNILQWQFTVPQIPPGTYQIRYNIIQTTGATASYSSCVQFSVTVTDPSFSGTFDSWYSATLLGKAFFTQSNYTQRTVGDSLQVGPSGPLVNWDGSKLPYGTITGLSGSGDLVPSGTFDTSKFVWGLSGVLQKKIFKGSQQTHIYQGDCYLGYIGGGSNYNFTSPLLSGTFSLNWTYLDDTTAYINGVVQITPNATLPASWGVPLLYGRLGQHSIVTSSVGFLQISASSVFCPEGNCQIAPPPPGSSTTGSGAPAGHHGGGISSGKLGLAIGLPIAFVFVVVLVAAGLIWFMNRRKTEQEDGIFAVARKPEYGSALVVDDIIEETKGNNNLRSMLNRNYSEDEEEPVYDDEDQSGDDEDEESVISRSRSHSRGRSISRSRSPSRSASESYRSQSQSERGSLGRQYRRPPLRGMRPHEESDPGESASRYTDSDRD